MKQDGVTAKLKTADPNLDTSLLLGSIVQFQETIEETILTDKDVKRQTFCTEPRREVLEANEKINEPKLELEKVATTLEQSESENTELKEQVSPTKEKLEQQEKKQEDLELEKKGLQDLGTELGLYEVMLKKYDEVLHKQVVSHAESERTKRALGLKLAFTCSNDEQRYEDSNGFSPRRAQGRIGGFKITNYETSNQKYNSQVAVISETYLKKPNLIKSLLRSSSKEELQAKESELEEVKVKLHELALVQEELAKSTAEKEALRKLVVVDLKKWKITQTKQSHKKPETEPQQLSSKIIDLTSTLARLEEEKKTLNQQVQDSLDKVTQLVSELTQSSSRNTDLEFVLKSVLEKSIDHEERANSSHQRTVELEDIIQSFEFQIRDKRTMRICLSRKGISPMLGMLIFGCEDPLPKNVDICGGSAVVFGRP
ncbi:hypothetical protein Tco_0615031 [Tanacetum coccineum]